MASNHNNSNPSHHQNPNHRPPRRGQRGGGGGGGGNRNRGGRSHHHHHRRRTNRSNAEMPDYSQEWLDSIQTSAGLCLQNHNSTMEDYNAALNYLNRLEAQLLVQERKWHFPPSMLPPQPGNQNNNNQNNYGGSYDHHPTNGGLQLQGGLEPFSQRPMNASTTTTTAPPSTIHVAPSGPKTSNRYALFQDDDDDDDDDDDNEEDELDAAIMVEDDEAGDQISFQPQSSANDAAPKTKMAKEPYIAGMDMRRIMIRIYNAQSDIFAAQALLCRKQYPPEWMNGANKYSHCLHKIHSALLLADTEISKWMSYMYKKNSQPNRRGRQPEYPSMYTNKIIELLKVDADIVQVAVQTMASNRAQYISAAKQLESKLLHKLRPQWRSRDEAKERMGVERWKSNTNPKNEFAQLRVEYEEELKDIRKAIQFLESSELDTTNIEMESKLLHEKIQMGQDGPLEPSGLGMPAQAPTERPGPPFSVDGMEHVHHPLPPQAPDQHQQQQQQHMQEQPPPHHHQLQRYNGMRPSDLSRRVDMQLYPDPTLFGWIFTGSDGVTEFFEICYDNNEVIKLDWYFTTGTIKTSMNHPVQGHTQLFGARVDPEMYRAILQNPRVHTGQRYQQRHHRNNNSNYHQSRH